MALRISIIIPTYESNPFLRSAVESVLQSRDVDIECLVVGSRKASITDEAPALNDPRLVKEFVDASHPSPLINRGLAKATGEIIGILNPDDVYEPDTLSAVRRHFEQSGGSEVLYGKVHSIGIDDRFVRKVCVYKPTLKRLTDRECLHSSAVFYRRTLLNRCGPFDESIDEWMHYEYWIRLAQAGVAFDGSGMFLARKRLYPIDQTPARVKDAALEAMQLTKAKFGVPGIRWAIVYGRASAIEAGQSRNGSANYDYLTISHAVRVLGADPGNRWGTWLQGLKVLQKHSVSELNKIRRKPRYLVRFLPIPGKTTLQKNLGRRLFQLRYEDPKPCLLPKSYFNAVSIANAPRISIVTPNLNQGKFIERTIRSVVDQSYPNLDYTVQDACSKDESLEVIRKHERHLSSWQSIRDRGQSHAINLGLARTNGEIMAYLNSDDLLLPGSLAYVARFFQENPKVDVVYGNRLLIDEKDKIINYWVLPAHDSETLRWADYVPQETLFWRRSAWEKVGGCVDDSFQFAMDWDLLLRFRQAGLNFRHLPRFIGAFRITESQKTSQLIHTNGIQEMNRLRTREFGYCPSEPEVTRHVKGYVRRQRYVEKAYQFSESVRQLFEPYHEWILNSSRPAPRLVGELRAA